MTLPDLIGISGRESLPIAERFALLAADLMQPPFFGISEATRASSQTVHDLKITVGCIRSVIELYNKARERGTEDQALEKGAKIFAAPYECWVLAWRRGGHREWKRIRDAQRMSGVIR